MWLKPDFPGDPQAAHAGEQGGGLGRHCSCHMLLRHTPWQAPPLHQPSTAAATCSRLAGRAWSGSMAGLWLLGLGKGGMGLRGERRLQGVMFAGVCMERAAVAAWHTRWLCCCTAGAAALLSSMVCDSLLPPPPPRAHARGSQQAWGRERGCCHWRRRECQPRRGRGQGRPPGCAADACLLRSWLRSTSVSFFRKQRSLVRSERMAAKAAVHSFVRPFVRSVRFGSVRFGNLPGDRRVLVLAKCSLGMGGAPCSP